MYTHISEEEKALTYFIKMYSYHVSIVKEALSVLLSLMFMQIKYNEVTERGRERVRHREGGRREKDTEETLKGVRKSNGRETHVRKGGRQREEQENEEER